MDSAVADQPTRQRQCAAQQRHLQRLQGLEKWPDFPFHSVDHLCLQVYRHLYDIPPRPEVPIGPTMPPSLARLFKGRDAWLAKIRQVIRSGQDTDSVCIVVLNGMGGLGKTRLAIEYAWGCAHEHSALLMVSGQTAQSLRAGLSELCGVLQMPQAASDDQETRIKATLQWLDRAENRGWLLIVDNVDTPEAKAHVLDTVQRLHRGTVVLTSRLDRWPMGFHDLHLDLLEPSAAVAYLLEATERTGLRTEGRGKGRWASEFRAR